MSSTTTENLTDVSGKAHDYLTCVLLLEVQVDEAIEDQAVVRQTVLEWLGWGYVPCTCC